MGSLGSMVFPLWIRDPTPKLSSISPLNSVFLLTPALEPGRKIEVGSNILLVKKLNTSLVNIHNTYITITSEVSL